MKHLTAFLAYAAIGCMVYSAFLVHQALGFFALGCAFLLLALSVSMKMSKKESEPPKINRPHAQTEMPPRFRN